MSRLCERVDNTPIEALLRCRVAIGFALAVLLMSFMAFFSWRSVRLAGDEGDLVTHTNAVMTTLAAIAKDVVDVDTGTRGFAGTGQEQFLEPYWLGNSASRQHLDALRHLTADNPNQQRHLDRLEPQISAALRLLTKMVATRRQTGAVPGASEFQEGKSYVDAVGTTIEEMQADETRLWDQRTRKTAAARRLTSLVTVAGTLVGVGFLALAGFAINREINVSAQARAQVNTLNAELEQRVEQRTAALKAEIAGRQQADEEIRKLNDRLEQRVLERTAQLESANKELEAFTYSVSHDLRAPLRHISGFSKILAEEFGTGLDPQALHYLQRIQVGTLHMGQLVDELLSLAGLGRHELHLQVTGLNSMLREVISILKPECEGRRVNWVAADLPFVDCDSVLIKQVLQNLLANALKFTRPREQARIEISHRKENGQTIMMVRDNGVGFSMKYADKLFGIFQRLHRAEDFEGTGIGLATVHRIIQKHGGRVWAEAELDKGATFYFTLGVTEQTGVKSSAVTTGA